ncbi:MAG: hypothetical protein K2X55_04450 [Burkholderiaceae bacterium]|nr:hypothetical protein [Burkholderiaceae bacterium]
MALYLQAGDDCDAYAAESIGTCAMHALVGAIPTCEAFILCLAPAFASDTFGADRFCRAQFEMRGARMHGGLQSALQLPVTALFVLAVFLTVLFQKGAAI